MRTKRTNTPDAPAIARGLRLPREDWDRLRSLCEEESKILDTLMSQSALLGKALKHYARLSLAVRVGLKEK